MALNIEYEKDLDTGAQAQMCHEPDSSIFNYYIKNDMALDANSAHVFGIYDTITFTNEERHLTTQAVDRIGVKNFPGIGGIGFYRDLYSDETKILAPIHTKKDLRDAPTLTSVTITDGKLRVVITHPTKIKYKTYRLVARNQYFATEYILYKTDYKVDLPPVKGTYTCHCIGYDESTGAVSYDSNELELVVTTGADSWAPDTSSIDPESYYTKSQIDAMIGQIGTALDVINGIEI